MEWKFFDLQINDPGVATVFFSRPPVNAVSIATYAEMKSLFDHIGNRDDIRVVILAAPANARAWCAGADLKEVRVAGPSGRQERYDLINQALPAFCHLDRPIIGAINSHCIGMGMVWASLCDIRIAAANATFSMPEVAHGMAAPIGSFLTRLNMPTAIVREMLFTGRKFTVDEFMPFGFFNSVTDDASVLEKATEMAKMIAAHRPEAVRATKVIANKSEQLDWLTAYKMGQSYSTQLAGESVAKNPISS